ncbi:MAG: hypothetical protein NTY24_00860 [Mycobacterium sp.]|nr:hypothetical protein [Mycobacterium sp.]
MPNVTSFTPISPVDYTVMAGNWYAFSGPGGLTCVINKQDASYGCSGPLPGAPDGANLISAARRTGRRQSHQRRARRGAGVLDHRPAAVLLGR